MAQVYMTLGKDGEGTYFNDTPDVREWQEARGWVVAEEPVETPFVSQHLDAPDDVAPEWLTMHHDELDRDHDFPNQPGVAEMMAESGWKVKEAPKPDPEGEAAEPPAKKTAAKKSASAKSAEPDTDTE